MKSTHAAILCGIIVSVAFGARGDDPLQPWREKVTIRPVADEPGRHSIHSYYVASPESPDGRHVLYFTSTDPACGVGEVRVRERHTGKETVLAANVHVEDAHRVACQQWLSGGRRVAFHEVVEKRWRVVVADVATGEKTVAGEDLQAGFGWPTGDLLPLYGCHWNPGNRRDLYLWNAATGTISTAATIAEVEKKYGDWLRREFSGKPCSIFFPVISPDLNRVFFKIAAGGGGDDYKSKTASHRQGLVVYDFVKGACLWHRGKWGHPGWTPDSKHIFEAGNIVMDIEKEAFTYTKLPDVPNLRGSHPSVSPDGTLMVTDGLSEAAGGKPGEWGILVASMKGSRWVLLHSFDQSQGAKSWRRNDPHPAFSADGRRIYYNVSDGPWTRLMVAERK